MKKYAGINTFSRLISLVGSELNTKLNSDDQITETEVYEMWGATISNDSNITENHTHDFVNGICTVCGAEDPDYVPPIEVAPDGELSNWSYTLDETNGTVTLNYYTGSATDVTVYALYQLNNNIYNTKIASNDSNVQSNYMFADNTTITSIIFNKGIDTSNMTSMSYMFYGCTALTTINGLEHFDTSNVTFMKCVFYNCTALRSLDLSNFNTSNVTNMYCMFYGCIALTSLDVSGWNTSKVTNMYCMFYRCISLTTLDVSGFDTSNVTNMAGIFSFCKALITLDVSGWDTSKVTDMSGIFQNCIALTEIKVTTDKWVIASGCTTTDMFTNCGVSEVTRIAA